MAGPSNNLFRDRRVLLGLGGLLALGAGLAIAFLLTGHDKGPADAPPASQGGLVVETGRDDDVKLDAKRPLRCFVGGQFVGELTLDECAKRNGVASGSLDVGVDSSGALAAANGSNSDITPLPPQPVTQLSPPGGVSPAPGAEAPSPGQAPIAAGKTVAAARGPAGACWRRAGGQWQKLPTDLTLNACVQALYAGHCERQGGATYGRWIDQTLRSVPGRIEVSGDNHDFRTLAEQGPGCAVPAIG
ncbi:hypothetical protein ACO2Q3_02740 [Caulobacter sp. KR2-114]|uniref:hypothetical protein n=1 Tax=Caulobacter sp. KR2-114 TaxID=3400912 RepID=UPI003C0678E4